ncbi:hypothetical protein PXX31_20095, partial [Vibrio cholerae]|uniref:hypothetical protein n=1 Tax=Vibrio cholerae TaxID=666 RepID=UPI00359D77E5
AFARTHAKVERDFDRRTLVYNEYRIHHIFFVFLLCRLQQGEVLEGYLQSQIVRDERAEGGPLVFALPNDLPLGYHTL